jgi:hypothetical protein
MPIVHLERELWDLRDEHGRELDPEVPERRSWLIDQDTVGRLRPQVEQLLADPATLAAAARQLLDLHFTPTLASLICAAVDLDLAALEASPLPPAELHQRVRRDEEYATLGANVVVELNSESRARQPTTRAERAHRHPSDRQGRGQRRQADRASRSDCTSRSHQPEERGMVADAR